MQEQIRIRWAKLIVNAIYIAACVSIGILTIVDASYITISIAVILSIICDICIHKWYIKVLQETMRTKRIWENELRQINQTSKII
jgi:hypothetical protein